MKFYNTNEKSYDPFGANLPNFPLSWGGGTRAIPLGGSTKAGRAADARRFGYEFDNSDRPPVRRPAIALDGIARYLKTFLLYPPEFFEYKENTVICRREAFVEDLFQVKRQGVLKARGLFQ